MWKKKSLDKAAAAVAADKANISLQRNEEEIQTVLQDRADMETELKMVREKLSSALSDCNAKAQIAQEAILGWEKMETEAMAMKQQLDKVLQEKAASEERLVHLDAALKESLRQLRVVREDEGNTSRDYEGRTRSLEEKLGDASGRLTRLDSENTQLSKALLTKEKVIQELKEQQTRMKMELSALLTRLESTEKDNSSLKYDVCVLEKQLDIRNEEREFNQRSADVVHKQYLESAKKIAKLESECQRLRLLLRKQRLPGPAALAKMKSQVEILARDPADVRRRKLNRSTDSLVGMIPDTPNRKVDLLTHQLFQLEKENRNLKEALNKKVYQLQPCNQVSEDTQNGHLITHLGFQELSLTSMSDMGSDDKASCAESWASALITELEHFKNGKQMGTPSRRSFGSSDINLMDDFVEMEKLATHNDGPVKVKQDCVSRFSPNETQSGKNSVISDVKQMVDTTKISNHPFWLADVVKIICEQCSLTNPSADGLLEDIKVALTGKCSLDSKTFDNVKSSGHAFSVYPLASSSSTPKSSTDVHSEGDLPVGDVSATSGRFESDVSICLHKIIELVEGINIPSVDGRNMGYGNSETPHGYMVRVLQWKTDELSAILEQFVESCRELSMGKVGFEKFTQQLTCTLEWILNHCFSIQDVSSIKDEIKNNLDWDDAQSEIELESGTMNKIPNSCKLHSGLPAPTFVAGCLPADEPQSTSKQDYRKLEDELTRSELAKQDLERRLQLQVSRSESLMIQLHELEKTVRNLQQEVGVLKQSNTLVETQFEKQKIAYEELDEQLTAAKSELDEACDKFLFLEEELDDKTSSLEKLKLTCLDLELQLRAKTEFSQDNRDVLLHKDQDIEAASETLAECQETITNLGKQFKALASPKDKPLFDKLSASPVDNLNSSIEMEIPSKVISQRSSLLDKMMAEDRSKIVDPISQVEKGTNMHEDEAKATMYLGANEMPRSEEKSSVISSNAIVHVKKKNGVWKKLLWTRNSNCKKLVE